MNYDPKYAVVDTSKLMINTKPKKCTLSSEGRVKCSMFGDVIVERLEDYFKFCAVALITIYENPKDYPTKFVARLFDLTRPTKYIVIRDSLESIRGAIPSRYMALFPKSGEDDECIVETYM